MNIASFALAAAFAAVLGYAQPASAQTQDRTGATTRADPGTGMDGAMMNHGSMMNGEEHGAATNGIGNDEHSGNGRDDDDNAAAASRDDGNQTGRRSGNERMHMGMGRMWRQRPPRGPQAPSPPGPARPNRRPTPGNRRPTPGNRRPTPGNRRPAHGGRIPARRSREPYPQPASIRDGTADGRRARSGP